MSRQIYRQEALERLSSPEQLDLLMPVTSARGWIALLGVGLLLLVALAWGVFGTIETTVGGSGLLMRHGGFDWIVASAKCEVTAIFVREGDTVKKGDIVAHLSPVDDASPGEPLRITAPFDGRVLDVVVMKGNIVAANSILLSVENPDHPLHAIVYVPASDGYRVEKGLDVEILPATENKHSANYLRGRVETASKFPATRAEMMRSLQNEEWVGSLLARGPTLEVVIELGSERTNDHLYSGTPCEASIIVQQRRPIEFLAPLSAN